MDDNTAKNKLISIILIAVNALLLFILIGMPKEGISDYVDYMVSAELMKDPDYSHNTDRKYYITVTDVTLTDKDGFPVNYSAGAKISYYITNSQLDRALDPDKYGEDGIEIGGRIISETDLEDTTKFKNITAEVREKCRQTQEQLYAAKPKLAVQKGVHDFFWFAFGSNDNFNYYSARDYAIAMKAGLFFALIAAGLGIFFYFKKTDKVISIYKVLIAVKVLAFVFVYLMLKR